MNHPAARSMVPIFLPPLKRKARFQNLYSELALHRAVLSVFTKPLFAWRKALSRSIDDRTLYDFARHTPQNVARLHASLANHTFEFRPAATLRYNFNGKHRTIFVFFMGRTNCGPIVVRTIEPISPCGILAA